jgi:hypothetical protein
LKEKLSSDSGKEEASTQDTSSSTAPAAEQKPVQKEEDSKMSTTETTTQSGAGTMKAVNYQGRLEGENSTSLIALALSEIVPSLLPKLLLKSHLP